MASNGQNLWAVFATIAKIGAAVVAILAAFWTFIAAPATREVARQEAERAVATQQRQLDRMESKIDGIEAHLRDHRE